MELIDIIVKPYLTEKTFSIRNKTSKEVIAFVVNPQATKRDIKRAFEAIYEVKIEAINIINKKPVSIKTGTRNPGKTKFTKIAYVTLPEGVKLAVTKEEIESAQEEIAKSEKQLKKASTEEVKTKSIKDETKVDVKEEQKSSKPKTAAPSKKVEKSSDSKTK
ncbi:50S ribosomal protein L23 [bacterium]|nr:50S ribosomal protein L23 [bacterium]